MAEGATGLVQNEDLIITVNEKVKDEQGNSVYTVDNKYNQAIYKYRNISALINGTELDPTHMTSTGGVKLAEVLILSRQFQIWEAMLNSIT